MYLRLSPYREILQGVLISLQINEGIIKIIGKEGAGKTALCSQLFRDLQDNSQSAVFFLKPPVSAIALQNDILDNLELDPTGNFTRTLTAYLLANTSAQKPLVLIFDDAQQLEAQTFSAIRMLCNIQDEARAMVRVVLCGNEDLDAKLATPALRAVTQFLSQSFTLPYLTQEQVHDFCQGYWLQANQDVRPINTRVLETLFRETKGHPGILHARLNQGTTGAEASDRRKEGEASVPTRSYRYKGRKPGWMPAVLITAGLVVLVSVGAYYYLTPQSSNATTTAEAAAPTAAEVATVPVEQPEAPPVAAVAAPVVAVVETESEPAPVISQSAAMPEGEVTQPLAVDAPVAVTAAPPSPEVMASHDTTGDLPASEVAEPVDAIAVASPPEPQEMAAPEMPPVEEFVNQWITSWQSGDVDAYLTHYHAEFAPAQGTLDEWRMQRRRIIENATDIMISVEAPELHSEAGDGMRIVRFWLSYRAANYADRTLKELMLAPVDGAWRIRAETSLRTERE